MSQPEKTPQFEQTIIAIDGPAGSGKSSVAQAVADHLNLVYLDSGSVYRAVTLLFLRNGFEAGDDPAGLLPLLTKCDIDLRKTAGGVNIFIDGEDITSAIRGRKVTSNVSEVAGHLRVREIATRKLREFAKGKGVVMDGRDIGTVVFPDADVKIYLTASLDERARRRQADLKDAAKGFQFEEIKKELAARDKYDSERKIAPLRQAPDAIHLDTSGMRQDEVVQGIINKYESLICHS